jgi:hypothetical protein
MKRRQTEAKSGQRRLEEARGGEGIGYPRFLGRISLARDTPNPLLFLLSCR